MHKTVYYKVTSFGPFSRPSSDLYTRTTEKTIQNYLYTLEKEIFLYTYV